MMVTRILKTRTQTLLIATVAALIMLPVVGVSSHAAVPDQQKTKTPIEIGPDGWQNVKSHHGHFSVLMPGSVTRTQEESASHHTTTYAATPDNGETKFVVHYTTYGSDSISRKSRTKLLKEAVHRTVSANSGKVTELHGIQLSGNDAIEFQFESSNSTAGGQTHNAKGKGRAIWANDTEYVLLADYTANGSQENCQKFLDSFQFLPYGFGDSNQPTPND